MQTLLFVVFFSTQASAYNPYNPLDPYNLYNQPMLPVQCSVSSGIYPCMHNGTVVRHIAEDPTRLNLVRKQTLSLHAYGCPDGSMPRQQFIASKKIGGPMELRYGCPEVKAKPPPQRVEQTYHPPPKQAQKPRALKPEQKVVIKEVPREVTAFRTSFNLGLIMLGFWLGRFTARITLGK